MDKVVNEIADNIADLISISEICKILGISRTTLDRWINNDSGIGETFPKNDIKIGNRLYWGRDTFKQWISERVTNKGLA